MFGGGISPTFHSRPLDQSPAGPCSKTRSITGQAFLAGFSANSKKDWSVSLPGYKGLVGLGVHCTSKIR